MRAIAARAGIRVALSASVVVGCAIAAAITMAEDSGTQATATKKDLGWVERRVTDWQPSEKERAFEEIGWVASLIEAQRLAKQHGRGVFLFTYDGASLSGYRC